MNQLIESAKESILRSLAVFGMIRDHKNLIDDTIRSELLDNIDDAEAHHRDVLDLIDSPQDGQ